MLRAVWRLLDSRQRRRLVALQLLCVLMAITTVGGIAAILPFFTVLTDPGMVEHGAVPRFLYLHMHFESGRAFVVALGLGFAAVVALANTVNLIGSLMMNRFAFQVGDSFGSALFSEYLHRPYAFHSANHSSILSNNVLHETGRVTSGILQSGLLLVTNLVTILFIVAAIVYLNPWVATCAIAGLGASYIAIYAAARGTLLRNGWAESRDFTARTKLVGEGFGAIKEIILLRAQSFFVDKFISRSRSISRTVASTHAISQSPRHVLECLTVCSLVVTALYLSGRGAAAGRWIAQLSFVGLAAYRLLPALQQAFAALVKIRADRSAFETITADLRSARARGGSARNPAIDPSWRGRPHREIRLHGVSFRHAADRSAAISNLTLRIPAGAAIGFIGANGAGKTTLVDLLAGLLVPQCGSLEVDGIAIDDTNRCAWQSAIAYVPQQLFVLDATLLENIALGVPASEVNMERIRAVAGLARLDECIAALPLGLREVLGEHGGRLSGGQRQRLGIARALYRETSVLIMDEATGALDAGAESEIIDALMQHRKGSTIFLIAHRLGSLRHCDLIFEIQAGTIARSGTYDELMAVRDHRQAAW